MSTKKKELVVPAPVPKLDPTKIQIDRITMIHGNLEATDAYLEKPQPPQQVKVDFGHRSGIDWKSNRTYTRLFVELDAENAKREGIGLKASYAFEFHFSIENLGDFAVKSEDGERVIHPILATTLMGIIFSTARGMVLERTKGTYLNGVILPVIAPKDLVNNWRDR